MGDINDIGNVINMLSTKEGKKIRTGMGPRQAKKQLKEFKRQFMTHRDPVHSFIVVGLNRKVKERRISNPRDLFPQDADVKEFSLDRLGENIFVMYNPSEKTFNRRLSSIMGHDAPGQGVFGIRVGGEFGDLTAEEFIRLESELNSNSEIF